MYSRFMTVAIAASVLVCLPMMIAASPPHDMYVSNNGDAQPNPPFDFVPLEDEKRNFVSATLGSNMVLQRDKPAMIWGFSTPGTTITTVLQKGHLNPFPALQTTVDGETGIWRQALPVQNATLIAYTITITSTAGESAVLENVLFGDVYLCSGQSNMQFTLDGTTNGTQEAHQGNAYPHIRLFTVGQRTGSPGKELLDLQTVEQSWAVANEISLLSYGDRYFAFGYFSAVCWFFGKEISDGLGNQVPIGLISSNWGGTSIVSWKPGGYLYNSMIVPYMTGPMSLTGFTWYQGEADAKNQSTADLYAKQFPEMIEEWRHGFQSPDAYFGFIQLSTNCPPEPLAYPMLREAQMAALDLEMVGYGTNIDHGFCCNVHPPTKQFCAKRLGKSALALVYPHYFNETIAWKSPSYSNATTSKKTVTQRYNGIEQTVTEHVAVITLSDVTEKGLYILDFPYNYLGGRCGCPKTPGVCAWASVNMEQAGWVNATISVQEPNQVVLTVTNDDNGILLAQDDSILETSYGWGSMPMMNLYDKGTDNPVLAWKENVNVQKGKTTTIAGLRNKAAHDDVVDVS